MSNHYHPYGDALPLFRRQHPEWLNSHWKLPRRFIPRDFWRSEPTFAIPSCAKHLYVISENLGVSHHLRKHPYIYIYYLFIGYTLEVNHHFKNGGSFWKMINLTIKNVGSETNLSKMVVGLPGVYIYTPF